MTRAEERGGGGAGREKAREREGKPEREREREPRLKNCKSGTNVPPKTSSALINKIIIGGRESESGRASESGRKRARVVVEGETARERERKSFQSNLFFSLFFIWNWSYTHVGVYNEESWVRCCYLLGGYDEKKTSEENFQLSLSLSLSPTLLGRLALRKVPPGDRHALAATAALVPGPQAPSLAVLI